MRNSPIAVACVCLLVVALANPLSAQGGGKKKHAADSSQPIPALQTEQTVEAPVEENTGIQRGIGKNGQIIIHWEFKNGGGSAELTISRNGSWVWSGQYDNARPNSGFQCMLVVKSGDAWQWSYAGDISKGGLKWNIKGQDAQLTAAFDLLAHGHVWEGVYRFPSVAFAKEWQKALKTEVKQQKQQLKEECEAYSWMTKQEWLRADPNHYCHQFNAKWY